jgi:hypothetical protein
MRTYICTLTRTDGEMDMDMNIDMDKRDRNRNKMGRTGTKGAETGTATRPWIGSRKWSWK